MNISQLTETKVVIIFVTFATVINTLYVAIHQEIDCVNQTQSKTLVAKMARLSNYLELHKRGICCKMQGHVLQSVIGRQISCVKQRKFLKTKQNITFNVFRLNIKCKKIDYSIKTMKNYNTLTAAVFIAIFFLSLNVYQQHVWLKGFLCYF